MQHLPTNPALAALARRLRELVRERDTWLLSVDDLGPGCRRSDDEGSARWKR